MGLRTIAILSPGDMGHGVGSALADRGYTVTTCLAARSERTRGLAARAGFVDAPSLEELVAGSDLIMSILPPARAVDLAREVAGAMRATGAARPFADCNAVSPRTASEIAALIGAAGGDFIDAGIIGRSPAVGAVPRIYTSGPRAVLMDEIDGAGVAVRNLGPSIGRASGLKMCYAALTKGTGALQLAMLAAAEALGLYDELWEELRQSQGATLAAVESSIPFVRQNAGRWVGEMEQIAETFDAAGVTPRFHQGAAEIFEVVAAASERDRAADGGGAAALHGTIRAIAARLEEPGPAAG